MATDTVCNRCSKDADTWDTSGVRWCWPCLLEATRDAAVAEITALQERVAELEGAR